MRDVTRFALLLTRNVIPSNTNCATNVMNQHGNLYNLLILGRVRHVLRDVLHGVGHSLWRILLVLSSKARRIGRGMIAIAEGLLPQTPNLTST